MLVAGDSDGRAEREKLLLRSMSVEMESASVVFLFNTTLAGHLL